MKRTILILGSILLALFTMACSLSALDFERGSGNVITEDREISAVSEVYVDGSGILHLTQGEDVSLTVEAEDNLMKDITTQVIGDRLYIKQESNWWLSFRPTKPIHYYLTLPSVTVIEAAGSADVVMDTLTADDLRVSLSGSSDLTAVSMQTLNLKLSGSGSADVKIGALESAAITGNFSGSSEVSIDSLNADSLDLKSSGSFGLQMESVVLEWLKLDVSGSTSVAMEELTAESIDFKSSGSAGAVIAGEVGTQTIAMGGSGSYEAEDLKSAEAFVSGSGSNSLRLWVSGTLTLDLSGSADVAYYGSPKVTQNSGGSTSLESLGEK